MKKEIPELQRLELNKQNVMKILFDFDFANNKHMNSPCNLPINIF